jgi:nitroreductase
MNLLHAIYTRRSVRDFTGEPVEDADIADLIDAAVQAPNAVNLQTWAFVAITSKALLKRVSAEAKVMALESLPDRPESAELRSRLKEPAFDIFYSAPALIVIWTADPGEMATHDCCMAAENLMLAAHAKGLGTCWIGLVEPWLHEAKGKAALGLPPDARPVAPIIVGYPKEQPAPPGRRAAQIRWIR